jgi:hypothetical protein
LYEKEPGALASTVVAGSPGSRFDVPVYTVLKTFGNWVPGRPVAMSASPDNGPKANRYVCVPSPIVAYPSPPEICWHLMAPFTLFAVGYLPEAGHIAVLPGIANPGVQFAYVVAPV